MNYHPNENQLSNLRPCSLDPDEEKRKAAQRKGGINSGKARREKRTMKMLLEMALSNRVKNKNGDEATKKEVSAIMLADKCARGDLRAIELAMNILGENMAKKLEVTGKDGQDLIPAKRLTQDEAAALMGSLESEY